MLVKLAYFKIGSNLLKPFSQALSGFKMDRDVIRAHLIPWSATGFLQGFSVCWSWAESDQRSYKSSLLGVLL